MENKYWTKKTLSTVCASSHYALFDAQVYRYFLRTICYKINYECTANYPAEFLLIKTLKFN